MLAKALPCLPSPCCLALSGELGLLGAEAIAAELEELPLPYRFDVQAVEQINLAPLLEHIERVGAVIYAA